MSTTQTINPTARKPRARKAAAPKGQATVTVLPTKAAPKAKAPKSTTAAANAEVRSGATPPGYVNRWPHAGYDLLRRTDPKVGGSPWLVRCNVHGETTEAADTKRGDAMGRKAERAEWCTGCAEDLAAKPAAKAKAAPKAKAEQVAEVIREEAAAAEADAKAAKVAQPRPARRTRKAAK